MESVSLGQIQAFVEANQVAEFLPASVRSMQPAVWSVGESSHQFCGNRNDPNSSVDQEMRCLVNCVKYNELFTHEFTWRVVAFYWLNWLIAFLCLAPKFIHTAFSLLLASILVWPWLLKHAFVAPKHIPDVVLEYDRGSHRRVILPSIAQWWYSWKCIDILSKMCSVIIMIALRYLRSSKNISRKRLPTTQQNFIKLGVPCHERTTLLFSTTNARPKSVNFIS